MSKKLDKDVGEEVDHQEEGEDHEVEADLIHQEEVMSVIIATNLAIMHENVKRNSVNDVDTEAWAWMMVLQILALVMVVALFAIREDIKKLIAHKGAVVMVADEVDLMTEEDPDLIILEVNQDVGLEVSQDHHQDLDTLRIKSRK